MSRTARRPLQPEGEQPLIARGGGGGAAARRLLLAAAAAVSLLSAASAAAAAPLTGFLATPTEQLGVPGLQASGELTPEGDLYTGWAEYEWSFGRRLARWDQPTRTMPDPSVPLYESSLRDGAVEYTQTDFAVPVGGEPVAYVTFTARNRSDAPRRARVGLALAYTAGRQVSGAHGLPTGIYRFERPVTGQPPGYYEQLGQAFSPAFAYSARGRDLVRSGLLLARGPRAAARPLPEPPASAGETAPHDGRVFTLALAPHASASLSWQIPLDPPAAGSGADASLDSLGPPGARHALQALWAGQEAGETSIELPEARVTDAYRAALVQILDSRFQSPAGWVQTVNRLQYQAFWIRDAAMEIQALDLAGLHVPAAQDLSFLDAFQQPDGLFISRTGQYDGFGQALWALGRHAQLTGSAAFATAQLPRLAGAVGWLAAAMPGDPLGLLPAGEPGDDELAAGSITGDDLWAVAGLREAIATARLAGREDLAQQWGAVASRLEASLQTALAGAVARAGHIPPLLSGEGGQDWGNYYAAYPVQVLPAASAAVSRTIAWARAHSVQGLPTYDDGASLHDYLGFPIFQTELERGEAARAVAGLYAELDHTTSTYAGWEWDVPPFGFRSSAVDMAPHGTFAADYVALLRDLLVSEEEGGRIVLLAGASPAWLAPGRRIAVHDAPVAGGGEVSFVERSSRGGETLSWDASLPAGTTLSWQLPRWARGVRVVEGAARLSGGRLTLAGGRGSVAVRFRGSRPSLSYAAAVAALNAEYRRHGRAAPLRPATP